MRKTQLSNLIPSDSPQAVPDEVPVIVDPIWKK
jgi:hypothetical protein